MNCENPSEVSSGSVDETKIDGDIHADDACAADNFSEIVDDDYLEYHMPWFDEEEVVTSSEKSKGIHLDKVF